MTASDGKVSGDRTFGPGFDGRLSGKGVLLRILAISAFPAIPAASWFGWSPLPPCRFRTLTGYSCPSCGVTRSFHALAHGEVLNAVMLNPSGVIIFCALLFAFLKFAVELCAGRKLRPAAPAPLVRAGPALLLGLWLGFGITRLILEMRGSW